MKDNSIEAIKTCMGDLNLYASESREFTVKARIKNNLDVRKCGGIRVIFKSNWHSGEGPYIEMDDAIKGYGIDYTSFSPAYQYFEYDENKKTLTIKDIVKDYSFTLKFEDVA